MKQDERNSWIAETEKTLVDSPVMSVIEQNCRSSEDGRKHRFFLLRSKDWCNIIPVTEDGKVVFVRQFRVGIGAHTLELPGGIIDAEDVSMRDAALREMSEETGYTPIAGARCQALGWNYPNPAIQNNRCHSFVVGPVRKTKEPKLDYGEMIDTLEIPLAEIANHILSGDITHALMLDTFFMATLKHGGSLSQALANFTKPST